MRRCKIARYIVIFTYILLSLPLHTYASVQQGSGGTVIDTLTPRMLWYGSVDFFRFKSVNEVTEEYLMPGKELYGWRYATTNEFLTLVSHAAAPGDPDLSVSEALNLISLLGPDLDRSCPDIIDLVPGDICGIWGILGDGSSPGWHDLGTINVTLFNVFPEAFFGILPDFTTGEISTCCGSFLVLVPEPSISGLFSIGLLVLGFSHIKARRQV